MCGSCCNECSSDPCLYRVDIVNTTGNSNAKQDTDLINPWGIVIHGGYIWVTINNDKDGGILARYDKDGCHQKHIGFLDQDGNALGHDVKPTGLVVNTTDDYKITDPNNVNSFTKSSTLLMCSESGEIFGYNCEVNDDYAFRLYDGPNDTVHQLFDASNPNLNGTDPLTAKPVYKGLAVTDKHLFVADFNNGKIDTFSSNDCDVNQINFNHSIIRYPIPSPFPTTGTNYPAAPFNIVYLDCQLYVLYAYQNILNNGDDNHIGGFIDIHDKHGFFVKSFIAADPSNKLNSPWGLARAPRGYGCKNDSILVGNFGDGLINIFEKNGAYVGTIKNKADSCNPLAIGASGGLWGLYVYCDEIYFASALSTFEDDGVVGVLKKEKRSCCRSNCCRSRCSHC